MTRPRAAREKKRGGPAPPAAKDRLIDALLAGYSQAEAARIAGVDPRTVSRLYCDSPEWRAEYERRRREIADEIDERMVALRSAAFDVLARSLERDDQQSVTAALGLLKHCEGPTRLEVSGPRGGAVQVQTSVDRLTDEQLEGAARAVLARRDAERTGGGG